MLFRSAVDLLAQQGLSDWSVFWEYSLTKSDGGGVTYGHAQRILFSSAFMSMLPAAERRDAVRHEVAHAIVGVAAGHSDVWRNMAIELGGSGAEQHDLAVELYPWKGGCPKGHVFHSVRPPGVAGFVCADASHEEPPPLEWHQRNSKSRAFDPGVKMMAETFPEPPSVPVFSVGETVYVIPFGSAEYDNAPLTVLEVDARGYSTRHADTGDEISVRHEMVAATPEPNGPDAVELDGKRWRVARDGESISEAAPKLPYHSKRPLVR